MICPKCSKEQSDALECAFCGVIISKVSKPRAVIEPPLTPVPDTEVVPSRRIRPEYRPPSQTRLALYWLWRNKAVIIPISVILISFFFFILPVVKLVFVEFPKHIVEKRLADRRVEEEAAKARGEPSRVPTNSPFAVAGANLGASENVRAQSVPRDELEGEIVGSRWYEDDDGLQQAKAEARLHNSPVLIYFYNERCHLCEAVDAMLASSSVQACLDRIVKVRIQSEHGEAEHNLFHSLVPELAENRFEPRLFVIDRGAFTPHRVPEKTPLFWAACHQMLAKEPDIASSSSYQALSERSGTSAGQTNANEGCYFKAREGTAVQVRATTSNGNEIWSGWLASGEESPMLRYFGYLRYQESVDNGSVRITSTDCGMHRAILVPRR